MKAIAAFGLALALAACAPARVEPVATYGGAQLPRPALVVVEDFVATPDVVQTDRGIIARLRNGVSGTSEAAAQAAADRKVTAAITRVLIAEIGKLGLPAVAAAEPSAQGAGGRVIVSGAILSIDEGNKTRRTLVGLGAGQSSVTARADVYYAEAGTPRLLESFSADAESGRKPGAAETMGAGAATGRIAESAAVGAGSAVALSGDVDADA
ncbi:MAG TPA: DUF4410 domain-containing protein, partial [Stellaceae bacterium]|nr:DUF4410 domain-containing protein [Stellaceae bacterium]